MCLHRITWQETEPHTLSRLCRRIWPITTIAWKVFEVHGERLLFCHGTWNAENRPKQARTPHHVPEDIWLTAGHSFSSKPYIYVSSQHDYYRCGFHAFTSQQDAQRYIGETYGKDWPADAQWKAVIRKVLLRDIHTRGIQDDMPSIVARLMKVPKQ